MRTRLAATALGLWAVVGVAFVLSVRIGDLLGLPLRDMMRGRPGIAAAFVGVYLIVLGGLMLGFRNEWATWTMRVRRWLATRCPWWKRMAGLSEQRVQHYLSFEFSRTQVTVGAWITIGLGVVLVVIGLALGP